MGAFLIHKRFQKIASLFPQKEALIFQKGDRFSSLTFQEVYSLALKINSFLRTRGFKFQDKAILYMENNPFWFPAYLGIVSGGGVCVPVDFQSTFQELNNILIDCEAKIIFSSPYTYEKIKDLKENFPIAVLNKEFFQKIELDKASFLDFAEDSLASLVYTSGTTDNPKAVMLSHRNFMANFHSIGKLRTYTHSDCFLCILPLHHTYPFTVNLLAPLLAGASVVFPQSLKKEDILFSLKKKKVTILVGVPQFFSLLSGSIYQKLSLIKSFIFLLGFLRERFKLNLAKPLLFFLHKSLAPNLKYMVCGGAKLDREVAKGLYSLGFNILEGYGLTESSPVVSFNPPYKIKIGSVGKPLSGVEVKTDAPDGYSQGEILVKGKNVSRGYFRKPNLTQKVFKDGWLHTKDIGFIDRDGYIYIRGRKDECLVLSSGKNIWPEELEDFYQELSSIEEIGIFNQGDSLYSVVVPNKSIFSRKSKEEIYKQISLDLQKASQKLAPYKKISDFRISFKNLPRTRLGKLRRFLLPKIFQEEDLKKPLVEDEFSQRVIRLLKNFLQREVRLEDDLSFLGVDSLLKIQLATFLEKNFKINIPEQDLAPITKVGELIEYLRRKELSFSEQEVEFTQWSEILKEAPASKFFERIRLTPFLLDIFLTLLVKGIFFFVFKGVYRLKVKGVNNLPKQGPFLICPNHASYLDGLVVFASFPLHNISNLYFIGLSEYFDHPLLSWLVKPGRIVPINVEKNLKEALKVSSLLLREKRILCIFPEGGRSFDGRLKEFKKGVGILSKELSVKIVPAGIKGTFKAWPASKTFPRISPLKIVYGNILDPQDLEKKDKNFSYQQIVNLLKSKVSLLLSS